MSADWRCGRCGAINADADVVCEACGRGNCQAPGLQPISPAKPIRSWDEPCSEFGCTKTVAQHREELHRLLSQILARGTNSWARGPRTE